jgi:hypothetical protein
MCTKPYWVKLSDPNANSIACNIINGQYRFVPLRGDINGDGLVDVKDIAIVSRAYGSHAANYTDEGIYALGTPASPNWDPRADLKPDNIIDIYDVVLVAVNYGKAG